MDKDLPRKKRANQRHDKDEKAKRMRERGIIPPWEQKPPIRSPSPRVGDGDEQS